MLDFLYRPYLKKLTKIIKKENLDPYEAYAWLFNNTKGMQREAYASTALTSGAHTLHEEHSIAIPHSMESAMLLAEQLSKDMQIDPGAVIEPVSMGSVGWSQSQYMEFWLAVIAGPQVDDTFTKQEIDKLRVIHTSAYGKDNIEFDILNNSKSTRERLEQYLRMATTSAKVYAEGCLVLHPVHKIIRMLDTYTSLGAQAECHFARELERCSEGKIKITILDAYVVRPLVNPEELLYALSDVNPRLAVDSAQIIQAGGRIFGVTSNDVRLMLIEDRPPGYF